MEKTYNIKLTLDELKGIITALKKFPMEQVESLVININKQFIEQNQANDEALKQAITTEIPKE